MNCVHKSKAENTLKMVTASFGKNVLFSYDRIYSPKVSVTASKRVPRRKRGGHRVSKLYQINLAYLFY